MSVSGNIKYSRGLTFDYETERYVGDVRSLHTRLSQIATMYPNSKTIFFYFHTEDNILSCVVNGNKLTWFAKAIVPSSLGIESFKGTYRIRNNSYSITTEIGSTAELF